MINFSAYFYICVGELRELGTLMRWFTFSSSPADLNLFFEETIIPVWIEKNDQVSIELKQSSHAFFFRK